MHFETVLTIIFIARYMGYILYIYTDFQVSESLHEGPEFSGNYLIDYTIGFIIYFTIITSYYNHRKEKCYWARKFLLTIFSYMSGFFCYTRTHALSRAQLAPPTQRKKGLGTRLY